MRFSYSARAKQGTRTRGSVEAASHVEAEEVLAERGYLAVRVRPSQFQALTAFLAHFQKPKAKDVVVFLRQFAVMVDAEVPIVHALRSLVRSTVQPALRAVIIDLAKDVESGRKLSDALGAHPRTFGAFAVHMVRAGETSGRLSEVVTYLADQAERDDELRARVRGAMVYPAFILGGIGIVAIIMMVFVIPRLTSVLQESGATLPVTTRVLIATSSFLASWWWVLAIVIAAGVVVVRIMLRRPEPRAVWDAALLRVPIFGRITREVAVVRLTRSFEMLLRGGVDVVPALEVVQGVIGNAVYERIIAETIREVRDGNSVTTVLAMSRHIPPMVPQLIAVGEETGRLQQVLAKLADYYAREVDQHVRNLVTVIEPLVMIVMGVAVGVMVSAVIMPMYNLASQF